MKIHLSIVALLSSLSAFAQGGHSVGNGGNGVVCYTDSSRTQVRSIELFDYWEMRQRYPTLAPLNLGSATLTVPEKIKIFTDRLAQFDANLAKAFAQQANMIAENIQYYLEDSIPIVNDDQSPLHPSAPCYKEQFAVQYKHPAAGTRRFIVKRALYLNPLTTNDTRAGLILHEVIYRHAIVQHQHSNSDGSRLFNYLFSGNPFAPGLEEQTARALEQTKIQLKKQLNFLRISGIQQPLVTFDDILLRDFFINHSAYKVDLKKGSKAHINKHDPSSWVVVLDAQIKTHGFGNWGEGQVYLNVDGSQYSYTLRDKRLSRRLNTPAGAIRCFIATIQSSGQVTVCSTINEVKLRIGSRDTVIPPSKLINSLFFNQQGILNQLYIDRELSVLLPILFDGSIRKLSGLIKLDAQGRATSGDLAGPEPMIIQQKVIYASTFVSPAENKITLGGSNPVFIKEKAEKDGLPLIVTAENEKDFVVRKMCETDRGYTGAYQGYGSFSSTTKTVTVVGSKNVLQLPRR